MEQCPDRYRLLSLWDIMNLFDMYILSTIMHKLTMSQMELSLPKAVGISSPEVFPSQKARAEEAMKWAEQFFTAVRLPDCLYAIQSAKAQWTRPLLDASSASEIIYRLNLDIARGLANRQFLRVADDRLNLLLHMRGEVQNFGILELFGDSVRASFYSAVADMEEAGNCLAAENNTAAVFHLMRVAEVGLRTLAKDRNAIFKNKPTDQQEWGTILQFLDGHIKQLREESLSKWDDPRVKDIQLRFYAEVISELRGFNEAWRRHLSHAREDAFYDRDYASSVLRHVKAFMQKLAGKIGQDKSTPVYWTAEEIK